MARFPRRSFRLTTLERRDVPATFAPNNLVVLRVGDGQTYTTTAPMNLEEYAPNTLVHTTSLTAVQSVNITNLAQGSTPGNQVITSDLTNGTGVGQLNRSFDSSLLTFGGIVADTAIGKSPGSANLNRVIATVGTDPAAAGGINTTTYGQFNIGDDLRAVALADGKHIYTVGKGNTGTAGVRFFGGLGSSPTAGTQISVDANTRGVTIGFDGRMYWTAAANSGVFTAASRDLPTAQLTTDTRLVANPGGSTEKLDGIWLADMNGNGIVDTGDRVYYTGSGTGLWVSSFDGTTGKWTTAVSLGNAPAQNGFAAGFVFGLAGQVVFDPMLGKNCVQLFVTTYEKQVNFTSKVLGYYDTDAKTPDPNGFADLLDLSTSSGLQGYRGVAFTPQSPTSITETASTNNALPSDSVTFAATLSSPYGTPTGTVNFIALNPSDTVDSFGIDHGTVIGSAPIDGTGHASISLTLPLGPNTVRAYYAGSGNVAGATSASQSVVVTGPNQSQTDITSIAPSPATYGQTVTLKAAVTGSAGTATGTVTFEEGSTVLGISSLSSGVATLALSNLSVGTHTLTAYFSGDANYKQSVSSGKSLDVHGGAAVSVVSSVNPSVPLQPVVFTATVGGNGTDPMPTGTVTFLSDGAQLGGGPVGLDAQGHATVSVSSLTAGSHFIAAQYNGDGTYATVTSPKLIQTIKQAFTPGNLIVERVGDGVVPLSSAATQTFLDEYTPAGKLVQSIALPNAYSGNQHILSLSGAASTEGGLTLSGDGHYLTLAGFDAPLGTPGLTATSPATIARVVGRIDAGANLDTSTAVTIPTDDALTNVRGAVTQDGKGFWIAGDANSTNTGIQYATFGQTGTPTPIGSVPSTARVPEIINGQLYVSTTDANGPLVQVGTGLPTSSTTLSSLPGLGGAGDPFAFVFFSHTGSGPADLLYIADQTGGLLKYYFDGSNWVQVGVKFDFAGGFTGLTGYQDASNNVVLFATGNKTATRANATNVITFTDSNPFNANFTLGNVTELVNVTALGEGLRGVAFVPTPAPVNPPTVQAVQVNDGSAQRSMVTSLKVTFSEAVTFPNGINAAFQLARTSQPTGGPSAGAPLGLVNVNAVQNGSDVAISFANGGAAPIDLGGSLLDGGYQLTIVAANVQGAGGAMVGNYQTPSTGNGRLFRLFGDGDGSGTVDVLDFGAFRQAFGTSATTFDYDAGGSVDVLDFGQFRQRFGTAV